MDNHLPDLTGITKPPSQFIELAKQPLNTLSPDLLKRCLTESLMDPGLLGFIGVMSDVYFKQNNIPTLEGFKEFIDEQLSIARQNYQSRIEAGEVEDRNKSTAVALEITELFFHLLNLDTEVTFNPTLVYLSDVIEKGDRGELDLFFEKVGKIIIDMENPITQDEEVFKAPDDLIQTKNISIEKSRDTNIELPNSNTQLDVELLTIALTKIGASEEEKLFLITTFIEYSRKYSLKKIELGIFELCVKERIMYMHKLISIGKNKFRLKVRAGESVLEEAIAKMVIKRFFPIKEDDADSIHQLLADLIEYEKASYFSSLILRLSTYFTVNNADELNGQEFDLPIIDEKDSENDFADFDINSDF
jgi:hypothetical protein